MTRDTGNTPSLSELGRHILRTCPNAYVNEHGQVIDPCHVWFSNMHDPTTWDVKASKQTLGKVKDRNDNHERTD